MYHIFFWFASACFVGCLLGFMIAIFWRKKENAMSQRKIRRKTPKIQEIVYVEINGVIRTMDKADIPLFLSENMDELAEICGLEMPDMSQNKMCGEHDLGKVCEFLGELKKRCFEKGILKNDLQIGGDEHEGKD